VEEVVEEVEEHVEESEKAGEKNRHHRPVIATARITRRGG